MPPVHRPSLLICIVLAAATIAVYAPLKDYEFVEGYPLVHLDVAGGGHISCGHLERLIVDGAAREKISTETTPGTRYHGRAEGGEIVPFAFEGRGLQTWTVQE